MSKQNSKKNIGIFSFFSGAGFLDLGFDLSETFQTLFVNEYHDPFMDVYKSSRVNLGISEPEYGYSTDSISSFLDTRGASLLNQNIKEARKSYSMIGFIGGPPCPDFSVAGKNRGVNGENGKLTGTYIELIIRNKPDFFLFENVKGLYRTKKHREFFNQVKARLISEDYYLTERLINSLEYGVPQDRERIILVGFKKSALLDYNVALNGSPFLKAFDWESQTRYSAGDILARKWPSQNPFREGSVFRCPNDIAKNLTVEHWFKKNDVENHDNSLHYFQPRAGLPKFQTIPEGDDLKKSYKRLHRWRYSPTAAYGNNEVHLHPYKARRISVADALAIQSLPKNFVIPEHISLTNMFKTIGNGVPFLAAQGLAFTISSYIDGIINKTLKHEEIISK